MELTINGKVYTFSANVGMLRELNQLVTEPAGGMNIRHNLGLRFYAAELIDGDVEALIKVLDLANKYTGKDRVTVKEIEDYIDDPGTDIDRLFQDVLDFLSKSNATKTVVLPMVAQMENQKKEQEKLEKALKKVKKNL